MSVSSDNSETAPLVEDPEIGDGLGRLLLTFLVATVLVFGVTLFVRDMSTAMVALIAAGVCCVAAVAGHFLSIYPKGDVFRLARLYQSMAIRIGIPVLFLFLCRALFTEQFDRGMVYFVLLFYLVGVLTEVLVQVRRLKVLQASIKQGMPRPSKGDSQAG